MKSQHGTLQNTEVLRKVSGRKKSSYFFWSNSGADLSRTSNDQVPFPHLLVNLSGRLIQAVKVWAPQSSLTNTAHPLQSLLFTATHLDPNSSTNKHRLCSPYHCVHFLTYSSSRFFIKRVSARLISLGKELTELQVFRACDSEFVRMSFEEKRTRWAALIEVGKRDIPSDLHA